VTVYGAPLKGIAIEPVEVPGLIDELPLVGVLGRLRARHDDGARRSRTAGEGVRSHRCVCRRGARARHRGRHGARRLCGPRSSAVARRRRRDPPRPPHRDGIFGRCARRRCAPAARRSGLRGRVVSKISPPRWTPCFDAVARGRDRTSGRAQPVTGAVRSLAAASGVSLTYEAVDVLPEAPRRDVGRVAHRSKLPRLQRDAAAQGTRARAGRPGRIERARLRRRQRAHARRQNAGRREYGRRRRRGRAGAGGRGARRHARRDSRHRRRGRAPSPRRPGASGAAGLVMAGRDPAVPPSSPRRSAARGCARRGYRPPDLYVNATSLAWSASPSSRSCRAMRHPPAAAFDVVYVPEADAVILEARARGLRTVTGTAMFVARRRPHSERWFGFAPKDQADETFLVPALSD